MSTTIEYIDFACEQIFGVGEIRYKKMFGEYMVYVNDKPILLVCDNTVFVKKADCIKEIMANAGLGFPYQGAKEHYVLDIEDIDRAKEVIRLLEKITPIPKKKIKIAKE